MVGVESLGGPLINFSISWSGNSKIADSEAYLGCQFVGLLSLHHT